MEKNYLFIGFLTPELDALLPNLSIPLKIKHLYVSFSGGADSLVLLFALCKHVAKQTVPNHEMTLEVVHFEHGIRGDESLSDAVFCRDVCAKLGLPFTMVSLDVPARRKASESLEEAARRLRCEWWNDNIPQNRSSEYAVALGHHADDRLESFFLRFMRGANCSGLDALRPDRNLYHVRFIRPLLRLERREIEKIAMEIPFRYRTDSTNLDTVFARNKLRNLILPSLWKHFPYAKSSAIMTLDYLSLDSDFIEREAEKHYPSILGENGTCIKLDVLREIHPALLPRLLRIFLSAQFHHDVVPERSLIIRLQNLLHETHPNYPCHIPFQGGELLAESGGISLVPMRDNMMKQAENTSKVWKFHENPVVAYGDYVLRFHSLSEVPHSFESHEKNRCWFDSDLLPDSFLILNRQSGDGMSTFPDSNYVSVKKLLTNAHIPASMQGCYPILRNLEDSKEIFWIPGVRRSVFAPITSRSTHFCMLSAEKAIDVSATVISRKKDGKILICSRPEGKHGAGFWEFPGGKIKQGESPLQCAEREVREELDMTVCADEILYYHEHDYESKYVRLYFVHAVTDEEPVPQENQKYVWVNPCDFRDVDFLPADSAFIDFFLKKIRKDNQFKE